MLKRVAAIWVFLFSFQLLGLDLEELARRYPSIESNFLAKDQGAPYWEGQQELHPVWDLMFYLTAAKTNNANAAFKTEVEQRLFSPTWLRGDHSWSKVPGAAGDFDVTAAIAIALMRFGYDENHARVRETWNWLKQHRHENGETFYNSDRKIEEKPFLERLRLDHVNILFRIFLTMLDITPRDSIPRFPTKILGFPAGSPMSPKDLGIFRTVLIPLLVWDFYEEKRHELQPIQQERLNSGGDYLGRLQAEGKLKAFMGRPIDEVMGIFGSDWNNFVSEVHGVDSQHDDNFWAQEGLGYLLARQQKNNQSDQSREGTWYVLGNSLATILAIQKIIDRGVASPVALADVTRNGIEALQRWRNLGVDENNLPFIPAARSNIWDTSLALQNLYQKQNRTAAEKSALHRKALWLLNSGVSTTGDWAWRNRLEEGSYMAWGFYPEAVWHPDTDDSAAVLEVLLETEFSEEADQTRKIDAIKKGIHWILAMRNSDGGFPAWEKATSKLSNTMMLTMLKGMPRVADFSQPDVTARVVRMLIRAKGKNEYRDLIPDSLFKKACKFFDESKVEGSDVDKWEGDWIADYGYGSAEVVRTLLELNERDANCYSKEEITKTLQWLQTKQKANGGWGEDVTSYSRRDWVDANHANALQSNFITKAFLKYEEIHRHENGSDSEFRPGLVRAIEFLAGTAQPDGNISEKSFTGVYVKGFIFSDYTLMPHYHSLGTFIDALRVLSPQ